MRQFAEPISPWAMNASDLARLRQQMADADRRVSAATSWTERTRAEQDAKRLRRETQSAETDRAMEARRNAPRTANVHARLAAQAIATGRVVPPVPYFARNACPASQLGATRATACSCGRHVWVEETAAGNFEANVRSGAPISFAALSAFVEQARRVGMLKKPR